MNLASAEELRAALLEKFGDLMGLDQEAWVVGGAIRDLLLGRPTGDADLALVGAREAASELALRIRGRLVDLGRDRMATWRVVASAAVYDLSELTRGSLDEDLARRDFTINALAIPLHGAARLEDPFQGAKDIEARVLRMVRAENLADDPLRILKGIRHTAVLGLAIDPPTFQAFLPLVPALDRVAGERKGAEIDLMFEGNPGAAQRYLRESFADIVVLGAPVPPEAGNLPPGDAVPVHALTFRRASREALHSAAARLRWSGTRIGEIEAVLRVDRAADAGSTAIDLALFDEGMVAARRAAMIREAIGDHAAAELLRKQLAVSGRRLATLVPLLSGSEIAEVTGMPPGPALGRVKRAMIEAQVRAEISTKEEAQLWLRDRAPEIRE
ncbi:MAG TPA: hypothetical protein VM557_01305 [Thermoanaerobaculia bacterium]|nr:hypothetical protein [Thermoanaerobaculia bacterium]